MALHQCFSTWITYFWVQIISSFTTNYQRPPLAEVLPSVEILPSVEVVSFLEVFPDNVIFDILLRLPAESVSICRMVCKKWLELTSTSDFAHIHLQRSNLSNSKVMFLQSISVYRYDGFFILNKEAEGINMFKKMNLRFEASSPILIGSSNGFLLFQPYSSHSNWYYYLMNVTTQECITIRCDMGILCGVFFHPLSKKYILILYSRKRLVVDGIYDYFLFTLEMESLRNVGIFLYHSTRSPVFCKGLLHWLIDSESSGTCEDSLMMFNVETEVFSLFSHPGKRCLSTCERDSMFLLELTGQLCFCRVIWDCLDMWVLEDYENCIWIKRHVVHLVWDIKQYPFASYNKFPPGQLLVRPLNIENGELLLFWKTEGLFAYNLEEKKVRTFDLGPMKVYKDDLPSVVSATCHVKSLVSLKVSHKLGSAKKFYNRLVIID